MKLKRVIFVILSIIFLNYILILSGTVKYIIFLNNLSKDSLANHQVYLKDLLVYNLNKDILNEKNFKSNDILDLISFLLITREDIKNRNFKKIRKDNIKNLKIKLPLFDKFSFSPFNNDNMIIIFEFSYLKLFWNISIKNN